MLSAPSARENNETAMLRKPDVRCAVVDNTNLLMLDKGDNKTADSNLVSTGV